MEEERSLGVIEEEMHCLRFDLLTAQINNKGDFIACHTEGKAAMLVEGVPPELVYGWWELVRGNE